MHGRKCILTAEPYDCYKITHSPLLIVLWVGHAQSKCRQTPMLDLGAINNPQRSFSTTTIIQEARPTTPTTRLHPTVTTPNIVTVHSKSSPSCLFTDTHPRCHVASVVGETSPSHLAMPRHLAIARWRSKFSTMRWRDLASPKAEFQISVLSLWYQYCTM